MNVITSLTTFKTPANAQIKLEKTLAKAGLGLGDVRWFIGVSAQDSERFVPVLIGAQHSGFAHYGIMVVS